MLIFAVVIHCSRRSRSFLRPQSSIAGRRGVRDEMGGRTVFVGKNVIADPPRDASLLTSGGHFAPWPTGWPPRVEDGQLGAKVHARPGDGPSKAVIFDAYGHLAAKRGN